MIGVRLRALSRTQRALPASLLNEAHRIDLRGLSESFEGIEGGGILLPLDHADVVAIEPGQVGKRLLCEPAFLAQSFEISGHDSPQCHGLQRSPSPSHPPPSILGFFAIARCETKPVPIKTPTIEVAFALDGDGESYVARIRSAQNRQPIATLNLPRAVVDWAVLDAAQPRLEVRLDGTVASYLDSGDSRTLSSVALSELIATAVSADALAGEDDPALIGRLETELERALEIGRRAQR